MTAASNCSQTCVTSAIVGRTFSKNDLIAASSLPAVGQRKDNAWSGPVQSEWKSHTGECISDREPPQSIGHEHRSSLSRLHLGECDARLDGQFEPGAQQKSCCSCQGRRLATTLLSRDRGSRGASTFGEFILAETSLDSSPFEKVRFHDLDGIRSDTT